MPKPKSRKKKTPKRVLALPDLVRLEFVVTPPRGDPTHVVQIGGGHRVSTGEGQRRFVRMRPD
jgi:hypothetical protein